MKMFLTKLHTLVNLLFIGFIAYSIILISKHSGVFTQQNLFTVFYLTFLAGIGSVILSYILLNTKSYKEIVYVDRLTNEFIVNKEEEAIKNEQSNLVSDISKEIESVKKTAGDIAEKTDKALSIVCNKIDAGQSVLFLKDNESNLLKRFASYALAVDSTSNLEFEIGEGLVGLVAKEQKTLIIDDLKESYMIPFSGLGATKSVDVMILPLIHENKMLGVWEISLLKKSEESDKALIQNLSEILSNFLAGETRYN